MSFGLLLRELRVRRAVTQFDLAAQSGISQSTISALETGKQRPWPSTRRSIAAAFEMTLAEFDDETTLSPSQLAEASESSTGSKMVERMVKNIHRLEDQNGILEQDIELMRRFIEDLPMVMWTTDRKMCVTSLIGWAEGRRERWPDAVGRGVADGLAIAFKQPKTVVDAHRGALAGDDGVICAESDDRQCHLRIEPRRDAAGDIVGIVGIALCQEGSPGNSQIALAG